MQQSPLTLTFQSALMESEFGRWVAQHHCKVRLVGAPRGGCFACDPARLTCRGRDASQQPASLPVCPNSPS